MLVLPDRRSAAMTCGPCPARMVERSSSSSGFVVLGGGDPLGQGGAMCLTRWEWSSVQLFHLRLPGHKDPVSIHVTLALDSLWLLRHRARRVQSYRHHPPRVRHSISRALFC
jgi:hypothetical protein